MNKFIKILLATSLFFSVFLFVRAAEISPRGKKPETKIAFPISELGNCGSKIECKAFCNKTENIEVCTKFAEDHNLINREEKQRNQNFSSAIKQGGPGGCADFEACKTFCEKSEHLEECTVFAEKFKVSSGGEISRAKKFSQALKEKSTPGECKSSEECKVFCEKSENSEVCLNFAEKNGFLKTEEVRRAKKFLPLMKAGKTPGSCKAKEECESYCHSENHRQECVNFMVKFGELNQEEAEKIKNTKPQTGPGGCAGKEECDVFCGKQEHEKECMSFAKERGLNVKLPPRKKVRLEGEIKDCVTKILGEDVVKNLDTKNLNQKAKTAIAKCRLESSAENRQENFHNETTNQNSKQPHAEISSVKKCLEKKLGVENMKKISDPTQIDSEEIKRILKECGYKTGINQPDRPREGGQGGNMPGGDKNHMPPTEDFFEDQGQSKIQDENTDEDFSEEPESQPSYNYQQ